MTPPLSQPFVPARLPPQHRRALVVAAALALALHAMLLLRWPALTQQVRAGSAVGTVSTRIIAPPAAPPEPMATPQVPEEVAAPPPVPAAVPQARPRPRPAARPRRAAPPEPAPAEAPSRGAAGGVMDPTASLLAPPPLGDFGGSRSTVPLKPSLEGEAAQQARQFAQAGEPLPARVSRAATLQYRLQGQLNGAPVTGPVTLAWRRTAEIYEADWESSVPALSALRMSSVGLVVPQGLVPVQAGPRTAGVPPTRFDYAQPAVHFASSGQSAALPPGTQDELSVVLQLGAWLAGDARRFEPGQTFELPIAGSDAVQPSRWLVEGAETITALGSQSVQAFKLTRLPLSGQGATASARLEVWLAEAMDYLPARLRWSWPDGTAVDAVVDTARLNRTDPAATTAPASAGAR